MATGELKLCRGRPQRGKVLICPWAVRREARGLAVALLYAGFLAACGSAEIVRQPPQEYRRLEVEFSLAWESAIRALAERGIPVQSSDPGIGVIETGWFDVNPDYAATFFVTDREDRYAACGKPGLFRAYYRKQARLILTLRPAPGGESALRVEGFFRTRRYSSIPLWPSQLLGDIECRSRGRLEEEVKLQVQARALAAQLERMRRRGQ